MGKFLDSMWQQASTLNRDNILALLEVNKEAVFLDVGCDDGAWSGCCADRIQTKKRFGVDVVEERLLLARERGIDAQQADIIEGLPFEDEYFDAIMSNQVIEHVANVDAFCIEIKRVLKRGGYAVISTENASSWVNVISVAMGWQMFSLTNMSDRYLGVGNPFAQFRGKKLDLPSWSHKTIFSFQGLKEFFEVHGFTVLAIEGAGYFPAPAKLGKRDPRHAHFITIKIQKV